MKDLRVDSSRNHLNEVATNRLCMDINRVLKKNTVSPLTFVIVTTKPIESIAKNLKMLLHKNNIVYRIQYTLSNKDINNQPGHIMYIMVTNPRADLKLPKKYIYYQVEQSNSNVLQSNTTNLNNSEIVWDYSIKNYENYKSRDNLKSIFYMPMPFFFEDTTNIIYDDYDSYDIYFYGSEIERRRNILNQMQKKYSNLKIGYGISGKERDNCIKSSKIVINLHYYETAALETARFNEVLQYNKLVISETSLHENDYYNRNIYKEFVEFVDVVEQDIGGLCRLIDMYLNNDELYHKKINYIKENKYKLMDLSEYFLKRNLLQLYKPDKIEINYALSSNKIYCLHLPETPERYHSFIQQPNLIDKHNIEFYPAIKYSPGWKGCAFSYVNLIYNAKRCNLKQITICEDDCCFNHDFNSKYNIILEFLQKLKQWDMFVGVVAALPEDTILHNIYRYKGMTFIEIDKMHSTVFNIYNHSCYDKILEFDINTESVTNAIDHHIKRCNFRIIVPFPFEFSCLNTFSTLWGKNMFNEYNLMFIQSKCLIKRLIKNYLRRFGSITDIESPHAVINNSTSVTETKLHSPISRPPRSNLITLNIGSDVVRRLAQAPNVQPHNGKNRRFPSFLMKSNW